MCGGVVCVCNHHNLSGKKMADITCEWLTWQWLHQVDQQSPWASLGQRSFHLLAPEEGREEKERREGSRRRRRRKSGEREAGGGRREERGKQEEEERGREER